MKGDVEGDGLLMSDAEFSDCRLTAGISETGTVKEDAGGISDCAEAY